MSNSRASAPPENDPDWELVARVGAGESAAFDELMRRYKQPVLNFAYRILGNAEDADDVTQDVFVRVYQHIGSYKPGGRFSTWLFALARNACIDRLRWRARHPARSQDAIQDEQGNSPAAPQPGVVEQVSALEIGGHIAAAVGELPEDQRTAIVLSEYHGMSYAEIAETMKCSKKSVEARLYRAKQFLRQRLRFLLE